MSFPIRFSSLKEEGLLQCSKWLKHAVLLSRDEMKSLLESLGEFFLIPASDLVSQEDWNISLSDFLLKYEEYLSMMQESSKLPDSSLRRFFSLMLSCSLESFYAVPSKDKVVIKAKLPPVQIQLFHCFFSSFDHQIRSMVVSQDSFAWGLQFSYPQIYEDPKTHKFSKVLLEEGFPDTDLFKKIVAWLRAHTQPVLFHVGEKKESAPFRIGKSALDLKNAHKGFQEMLKAKEKAYGA